MIGVLHARPFASWLPAETLRIRNMHRAFDTWLEQEWRCLRGRGRASMDGHPLEGALLIRESPWLSHPAASLAS